MACIVQKETDPEVNTELSYYKGAADISNISSQEILTGIRDGGSLPVMGMGGSDVPIPT